MSFLPDTVFKRLDMLAQGSGLFRVDQTLRSKRENEILAKHPWKARLESLLLQASEHGVDWVYFRLESGTGGPKPEAYIFDHTSNLSAGGSPADIAKLHLELWNYGKVPLAFVLRPTAVDIFNLLQAPEFGPSGLIQPVPLETLDLSPADTLAMGGAVAKGIASQDNSKWQRFSGARFDNGSFWEMSENRELGSNERGSLATMVKEMRLVRQKLEKDFAKHHHLNLKPEESNAFVHRLLILTLMVRFMEAREIIPPGYFADMELLGATDFKSLLPHRTPLLRALDRLAADFNGDIFTLSDQPGEVPMRSILSSLPEPEKHSSPSLTSPMEKSRVGSFTSGSAIPSATSPSRPSAMCMRTSSAERASPTSHLTTSSISCWMRPCRRSECVLPWSATIPARRIPRLHSPCWTLPVVQASSS